MCAFVFSARMIKFSIPAPARALIYSDLRRDLGSVHRDGDLRRDRFRLAGGLRAAYPGGAGSQRGPRFLPRVSRGYLPLLKWRGPVRALLPSPPFPGDARPPAAASVRILSADLSPRTSIRSSRGRPSVRGPGSSKNFEKERARVSRAILPFTRRSSRAVGRLRLWSGSVRTGGCSGDSRR